MEKPLKILYLITKSNYGGAQKYVLELAKAAKSEGHEVKVAAGGTGEAGAANGRLFKELIRSAIPVISINSFMRDMSLTRDIKAFLEVYKLLKKEKPEVLHLTSSKAGGIGALAGRLAGVPKIIFTSHGLTIDETWRPRWQQFLIKIGTWFTLILAHHSIMINSDTTKRAKAMFGLKDRVSLIKNGIEKIDFLSKAEARTKLAPHLPESAIWIGGVGELHINKNWSVVIEAMSLLPENVHLTIIGEGDNRKNLEKLIDEKNLSDRVHLLGFVEEASRYLKAYDIFILPSLKEGLPYVLLEAGQAGLPIVASELPGNSDIIKSAEDGFLIKPTPENFSSKVVQLLKNENLREQFSHKIVNKIEQEFSVKRMFRDTFVLYQDNKSEV